MREIEFRAWIGDRMEYRVLAGAIGSFFAYMDERDKASAVTTKYADNVPLMQLTSLKDKNGTDIYEGDIVDWNGGMAQSSIVWLDGGCWGTSQGNPLGAAAGMCEVIGNIYENPELLEA